MDLSVRLRATHPANSTANLSVKRSCKGGGIQNSSFPIPVRVAIELSHLLLDGMAAMGGWQVVVPGSVAFLFLSFAPALTAAITRSQQRRISAASAWCSTCTGGDAARRSSLR